MKEEVQPVVLQGRKPTVFVSSTCYDLKQVRNDLKSIIEEDIGLEAMLSEYESFPIDPSLGTVENCLRIVEQRADIFILIIGSRYGSTVDNGKSITNLEYLRAKAKGIPIYAFVDKSIMRNMPLWRKNPTMDFSPVVDNPALFNFAEEVMSVDSVWVHEFEVAKDIATIIKSQLSYLFFDSLELRKSIKHSSISKKVAERSPAAMQLVLEKPFAWEYRFFSQILFDELLVCKELRKDVQYHVFVEFTDPICDIDELKEWAIEKNNQLGRTVSALSALINEAFPKAIGAPGEASDLDFLIYIVERISKIYKNVIDLQIIIASTTVPEGAQRFAECLIEMYDSVVNDIERMQGEIADAVSKVPEQYLEDGNPIHITVSLELSEPDSKELIEELEKLYMNF